ncbi:MAG: helix-hairpin-helix domain-containing protein [Eubacteriales bacterium]|nr:helix-hairpin-helix domain-containing protein [Eubacteriales bacterium]
MKITLFGRELALSNRNAAIVAAAALLIVSFLGYMISMKSQPVIAGNLRISSAGSSISFSSPVTSDDPDGETDEGNEGQEAEETSPAADELIYVYVTGCVKSPGVIQIKRGSIIKEAVDKAGGFTDDADIYNVNLVYRLYDNTMLRIKPVVYQVVPPDYTAAVGADGSVAENSEYAGTGCSLDVITGPIDAVIYEGEESCGISYNNNTGPEQPDGACRININKATAAELEALPGIGPVTAAAIVSHRNENGYFSAIEDIMAVPGIKQGRFDQIKNFIYVDVLH